MSRIERHAATEVDRPTEVDTTKVDTTKVDTTKVDTTEVDAGTKNEPKTVTVGMDCAVKNLYQKWDQRDKFTWTETLPDDVEKAAAENASTAPYAVLVRNKKSYDARKTVEVDSIVVQSPLLKKALGPVLEDYPGVTTTLQRLVFSAPFQPFVHRWKRLEAAVRQADASSDKETQSHLHLLLRLLRAELGDVLDAVDDCAVQGVVTYELAWTVFHPGKTLVLTSRYGAPMVNRLVAAKYIKHQKLGPCLAVTARRVDFDGFKFGYVDSEHYILPFEGTCPVNELSVRPLSSDEDKDEEGQESIERLKEALTERGRLFEALSLGDDQQSGYAFRQYVGHAIKQTRDGPVRVQADGRIVLDRQSYDYYVPESTCCPTLLPLTDVITVRSAQARDPDDEFGEGGDNKNNRGMGGGRMFRMSRRRGFTIRVSSETRPADGTDNLLFEQREGGASNSSNNNNNNNNNTKSRKKKTHMPLTKDQLLLSTPMVHGFHLRTKQWLEFYADQVGPVVFDHGAFDRLVLPEVHKNMILGFTEAHRHGSSVDGEGEEEEHGDETDGNENEATKPPAGAVFDDIISGKGRGIILLLAGGPGIGKTLTAESVAETMQTPLYVLSAGELGGSPYELEESLEQSLRLVARWRAVLLIDECDVFLERRTAHSLARNSIVSIFLRMLEYYEGILFLTTNRIANIDEAFHSRIHVTLQYPDLDVAARRRVWADFLDAQAKRTSTSSSSSSITEEQLDKLAHVPLNGRQIKNTLKIGYLRALYQNRPLSFEDLQLLLQVGDHKLDS